MTSPPLTSNDLSAGAAAEGRQARFWDRLARRYAAHPIADQAGYEATLARVASLLSPQDEVLEIGCGTGTTALRLAPGTGRYLATDLSEQMLGIARERQSAQPVPQLQFARAGAGQHAGEAGRFDAVLAFNVLHLVGDLEGALAGVARSLRPGGLLVSKTPCIAEMNRLIPWLALPLMRAIGKAPEVLSFDAPRLQAAIERQGFAIEAVERHGTRGKDFRVFIVARAPGAPEAAART